MYLSIQTLSWQVAFFFVGCVLHCIKEYLEKYSIEGEIET